MMILNKVKDKLIGPSSIGTAIWVWAGGITESYPLSCVLALGTLALGVYLGRRGLQSGPTHAGAAISVDS